MRIAHVNADRGIAPDRKKGASVHVEAMRRAFRDLGADVIALDIPDRHALGAALERAHALAAVDLVYERLALESVAAVDFSQAHGVPYVLEVNSPLDLEAELYRAGNARTRAGDDSPCPHALARADLVLAVSAEVAQWCCARGAAPERVLVRPNAVDPILFQPRAVDDPLRAELVPPGRFAFGFHGRLRPWHNFELLVEALSITLERSLPVHLIVLGEGDFDTHLAGRFPNERVTRSGWRAHADAARIVACFDALPLTYDPRRPFYYSPLKLLEAMAVGAVPLVPDLGALGATAAHMQRGLVYPAGDVHALADAMGTLVSDPLLHARLGADAREYASSHSWRALAREVLDTRASPRVA